MHAQSVQIGNSMGLRLPRRLINQFYLDMVEIELFVENNGIKIKSVAHVPPLETWDLFFKTAIADNKTVDNDVFEG